MDLDLFDAFEEGGAGATAPSDAAQSSEYIKYVPKAKRLKKNPEDGSAAVVEGAAGDNATAAVGDALPVLEVPADLPVFTSEMVIKSETGTTLKHYSAVPVDYKPEERAAPIVPAKIYPFKLDPFQQEAVNYIDRDESVLVAAHTSAGKTAVAEYAIAKSLKNRQRVIYTSPIKALSNQKYRDLQEEFTDVGLMTGDMTINPTATCLIMTTEILRSMLFRGSEVMREVAWVIYDEVHYMRDKERGVVWEESIILLPHKVRFVFLSATIPNAKEFVGWVAKTHHQPCHVVYTDYRPTPLQHFVFPAAADGLYLVVDEKGNFRDDNFQRAMSLLQNDEAGTAAALGPKKKQKVTAKGQSSDLFKIIRLIMERDLDPVIVFSFSKKECESNALQTSRFDFNSEEEKALVEQVFGNAVDALAEDDKKLPQIETLLPLLRRGIGIHHGGLLPILKEIIEILFQEGLIKCLFATETFSIGINMPAKTVVFTQTRKYDGKDFRWITSGEYIQMSGRAGRRGKDTSGIVIQMLDEKMEPDVAKGMIYGDPDPLYSSYHIGYNMVLNMLRVEDADPEHLLRSSFHQYQQEKNAPQLESQADEIMHEANAIVVHREDVAAEYFQWCRQLQKTKDEAATWIRTLKYCLPFLQQGRLVQLSSHGVSWGWGVIVQARKTNSHIVGGIATEKNNAQKALGSDGSTVQEYILDVLVEVVDEEARSRLIAASKGSSDAGNSGVDTIIAASVGDDSITVDPSAPAGLFAVPAVCCASAVVPDGVNMEVVPVSLDALTQLSAIRIQLPKDLRKESNRRQVQRAVREVLRRFPASGSESVPVLDPVTDMNIRDPAFSDLQKREDELNKRISGCAFHKLPEKDEQLSQLSKKYRLIEAAQALRTEARSSQAVAMRDELRRMKRVLRRLGYISSDGVLELKGRFACELSMTTGNELVLTDMIFDGFFNDLSASQSAALLSSFVHEDMVKDPITAEKVRPDLQASFRHLQAIARNVAKVSIDAKITIDEKEFVNSFNPELMEVAFLWCNGAKFSELCKLTDVFEGSIIRVLRRLEELLRQVASAAVAIGNLELKTKFEEAADKIRRGIVFAASLYL